MTTLAFFGDLETGHAVIGLITAVITLITAIVKRKTIIETRIVLALPPTDTGRRKRVRETASRFYWATCSVLFMVLATPTRWLLSKVSASLDEDGGLHGALALVDILLMVVSMIGIMAGVVIASVGLIHGMKLSIFHKSWLPGCLALAMLCADSINTMVLWDHHKFFGISLSQDDNTQSGGQGIGGVSSREFQAMSKDEQERTLDRLASDMDGVMSRTMIEIILLMDEEE